MTPINPNTPVIIVDAVIPAVRRVFARIFTSERFGMILVEAVTDDDGMPGIRVVADTHPNILNPSAVTFGYAEGFDNYERLEQLTVEEAESYALGIATQINSFGEW